MNLNKYWTGHCLFESLSTCLQMTATLSLHEFLVGTRMYQHGVFSFFVHLLRVVLGAHCLYAFIRQIILNLTLSLQICELLHW